MCRIRTVLAFASILGSQAQQPESPEGPNQQCRDDAGPLWADDVEHFPGGRYHDHTPATPVLDFAGDCKTPLKQACQVKSARAAYLDGPIDCGNKGWFCRIMPQEGWRNGPEGAEYGDKNFAHCNATDADERDNDGHCHGSDKDDVYGWWVRDHWFRGYAGTLHCCCDWQKTKGVVNRCDYRRQVQGSQDQTSCRDANEGHNLGYDGTCEAFSEEPFADPVYTDPTQCWTVTHFANPESVNGYTTPPPPATPTPSSSPPAAAASPPLAPLLPSPPLSPIPGAPPSPSESLSPPSPELLLPPSPPSSSSAPPSSSPGACKSWCSRNTKPWDIKCTWRNCGACNPCAPGKPPSPPPAGGGDIVGVELSGAPKGRRTDGIYMDRGVKYRGFPLYQRKDYKGRTWSLYHRRDGMWVLDFNKVSQSWKGTIAYSEEQTGRNVSTVEWHDFAQLSISTVTTYEYSQLTRATSLPISARSVGESFVSRDALAVNISDVLRGEDEDTAEDGELVTVTMPLVLEIKYLSLATMTEPQEGVSMNSNHVLLSVTLTVIAVLMSVVAGTLCYQSRRRHLKQCQTTAGGGPQTTTIGVIVPSKYEGDVEVVSHTPKQHHAHL